MDPAIGAAAATMPAKPFKIEIVPPDSPTSGASSSPTDDRDTFVFKLYRCVRAQRLARGGLVDANAAPLPNRVRLRTRAHVRLRTCTHVQDG